MDYESEIVEFLSQKENIIYTLEIGERVEQVKNKLQEIFWINTKKNLDNYLREHEAKNRWQVSIEGDLFKNINKNWVGLNIEPINKENLYLHIGIAQEYYRIFYGFWWNEEIKENYSLPEVLALTKELQKEKYNDIGVRNSLGWKWTDYKIRDRNFLLSVADNNEIFAKNIADLLWDLFIKNVALMDAANLAISQAISKGNKYP